MFIRKKQILTGIALVISILLLFTACPVEPPADNNADDGTETDDGTGDGATTVDPWITSMEGGDYEEALTALEREIENGSTDTEVLLYAGMLQVSQLSSSPAVKNIASAAGFSDYPDSINDMISTGMPTVDYDPGEDVFLLPKVVLKEGNIVSEITNQQQYIAAVTYNLLLSYPDGLNAPVSQMIAAFDSLSVKLLSGLSLLSAKDKIVITKDMITHSENVVDDSWPVDADGNALEIVIGKAEVLSGLAALEAMAAVINYAGSIDYSFPLKALVDGYNPVISDIDWSTLPENPMRTLLQTSDNADNYLGKAKTYFSSALGHLAEAAELISLRDATSDFNFSPKYFGNKWATSNIKEGFIVINKLTTKMKDSVDKGTTFYLPVNFFGPTWLDYATSVWPTAADWGSVSEERYPTVLAFKLSALFDQPLIALDSLLAVDPITGEPIAYNISGEPVEITEFSLDDYGTDSANYGFKFNDYTLGGLIQDAGADLVDEWLNFLTGLPQVSITVKRIDNNLYISPVFNDLYFGMFSEAGTTFNSILVDDAEPDIEATGSFWYQLLVTAQLMTPPAPPEPEPAK